MNEYEQARLMNVVHAWLDRKERTYQECEQFVIGVMAVVDVLDGMTSEQAKSIQLEVEAIVLMLNIDTTEPFISE